MTLFKIENKNKEDAEPIIELSLEYVDTGISLFVASFDSEHNAIIQDNKKYHELFSITLDGILELSKIPVIYGIQTTSDNKIKVVGLSDEYKGEHKEKHMNEHVKKHTDEHKEKRPTNLCIIEDIMTKDNSIAIMGLHANKESEFPLPIDVDINRLQNILDAFTQTGYEHVQMSIAQTQEHLPDVLLIMGDVDSICGIGLARTLNIVPKSIEKNGKSTNEQKEHIKNLKTVFKMLKGVDVDDIEDTEGAHSSRRNYKK